MNTRAIAVTLALVAACGGAAAALLAPSAQDTEEALAEARQDDIRTKKQAMVRHLGKIENYDLINLVAGREVATDVWAFRGAARRSEARNAAAFGQVRIVCAQGLDRPECWKLETLFVDGVKVFPPDVPSTDEGGATAAENEAVDPSAIEKSVAAPTAEAPEPTAQLASVGAAIAPEAEAQAQGGDAEAVAAVANEVGSNFPVEADIEAGNATPLAPKDALVDDAALATHRVRASEVNARSGPGRSNEVLLVASRGQELQRIGNSGGWGRYRLIGGADDGLEVWIFDRLVETAQ